MGCARSSAASTLSPGTKGRRHPSTLGQLRAFRWLKRSWSAERRSHRRHLHVHQRAQRVVVELRSAGCQGQNLLLKAVVQGFRVQDMATQRPVVVTSHQELGVVLKEPHIREELHDQKDWSASAWHQTASSRSSSQACKATNYLTREESSFCLSEDLLRGPLTCVGVVVGVPEGSPHQRQRCH